MSAFGYDEVSRHKTEKLPPVPWDIPGLFLEKPAPGGKNVIPQKSDAFTDREIHWEQRKGSEVYSPFPKGDPAKIDQDIAKAAGSVGSNRWEERDKAERTLTAGGLRSLPTLRELQRWGPNKDVRDSATELINHIELRSVLSGSRDAIAEHEQLDRVSQKLPRDWPDKYERLVKFMDNEEYGGMLDRQLQRLRQDARFRGSLALADLEQLNEMRTRLRLDYAEQLLKPGENQNIPKATELLRESLEKGLIDPADVQFLRLAKQAGAFDNPEFRRTFLDRDGDITDVGRKFSTSAEAEQYYRRRLAAITDKEKGADAAPKETKANSARRTITERLAAELKAQHRDNEAKELLDGLSNDDLRSGLKGLEK
jgi:hypothetical protein